MATAAVVVIALDNRVQIHCLEFGKRASLLWHAALDTSPVVGNLVGSLTIQWLVFIHLFRSHSSKSFCT